MSATQFKPGQSGNPGGRPSVTREVRALAQEHSATAVRTLVELMTTSADERVRLAAATAVLDRGVHRVATSIEEPDDREPVYAREREELRQLKSDPKVHDALLLVAEAQAKIRFG